MEAGRELDALVAEKVMGWRRWDGEGDYDGPRPMFCDWGDKAGLAVYVKGDDPDDYFAPSTDIAAAWQVVEKLSRFRFQLHGPHDEDPLWHAVFIADGYRPLTTEEWKANADTAPDAICLAALKAVEA